MLPMVTTMPRSSTLDVGRCHEEGRDQSILSKEILLKNMLLDNDGDDCLLSVFFGGVGDARHVFVTLMDIHKQVGELSPSDKTKFRFHFTMNDVKAAVLAKGVIYLVVLKGLGEFQAYSCVQKDAAAGMLATLMHYLYLGLAMPPQVYEKLREVLEELLSYQNHDEFSKAYPFIRFANSQEWEEMRLIWVYWINEGGNGCHFPSSVEEALDNMNTEWGYEQAPDFWNRENPEMAANVLAKGEAMLEERRTWMREQLSDVSNWTPETVTLLKHHAGPDASTSELLDCVDAAVDGMSAAVLRNDNRYCSKVMEFHKLFVRQTHVLLPPTESENANPEDSCFQEVREAWADDDRLERYEAAMKDVQESVLTEWRVNPTYFDPYWSMSPFYNAHKLEWDPTDDFCESFLGDALDYMTEKPEEAAGFGSETRTFFALTSLFFWNVSHALSQVVQDGTLEIEIRFCPINTLTQSIRLNSLEREKKGWPVKYQRIRTSNIPDYTGMLSIFVDVLPLLHESTSKVHTHMESNVLFNTGLWDDYEHYIYSSTAIPTFVQVESILGLVPRTANSVWPQHYWTWSQGAARATRNELTTWLQRLYIMIMLPAEQDSSNGVREEYASTTATFVNVCEFLVQVRGYPAHWIVSAIDGILQGGGRKFKTRARAPSIFPNRYQPEKDAELINLSAFSLELETQLALWIQSRRPSPLAACKFTVHEPVHRYMIRREFFSNREVGNDGNPNARCIGVLLRRYDPNDPSRVSMDPKVLEDRLFGMMMNMMGRTNGLPLRDDVLSNEGNDFVVLSCVDFVNDWNDQKNQEVSFYLAVPMFQKYQSYYVSILRTDSWACLDGYGTSKLKEKAIKLH